VNEVVELIRRAERVTTICHENPDGDTLGAAIAIAIAAERLGKQAEVVSGDPPPPFLAVLPRIREVRRAPQLEPDLAVIVDTGDLRRTGRVAAEHGEWLERATIAVVDHHVSNPGFGAANWIDPGAAATCEMVTLMLPSLGVELDEELATVLLTGIVQDTHTFAHPHATPRTLRVAAELVEAGAPLARLNRAVYADKPFSTLKLWGRMLNSVDERCEGRIVHASMTLEMLRETGEEPNASEGFVDLLGSTKAADITLLLKQVEPERTRVSVRTSDRADAVAITAAFGGGGHARAAGCTVEAPIDMARDLVLAECERELARGDARGR
jgi:phosphoesterase RecJ-like protein